jgi:hypothetical protein
MAASKCASSTSQSHFSLPPAVPMTRPPQSPSRYKGDPGHPAWTGLPELPLRCGRCWLRPRPVRPCEGVSAFDNEGFCRGEADAGIAAVDDSDLPFKLSHNLNFSRRYRWGVTKRVALMQAGSTRAAPSLNRSFQPVCAAGRELGLKPAQCIRPAAAIASPVGSQRIDGRR